MDIQFITRKTLTDADIDLAGEDVTALLVHLNEELQERVGAKITDALSEVQLQTMVDMQDTASEDEMSQWIHDNAPNMEAVVEHEITLLLDEIIETDDESEE